MVNKCTEKIIFVSYYFSSQYETGGIRAQNFVKYLPQYGFEPIVITKRRTNPYEFRGRVSSIKTIRANWPFHLEAFTWLPGLFITCMRVIKNEKIKILFFSCGPFSAALVGMLLKKCFNVKLFLDYRDYWTISPYLFRIPRFNRLLNLIQKPLEKFLLKSTDKLITVQKSMEEKYEKTFPFLRGRIETIFNGFDAEDFSGTGDQLFKKFTLLHLGNIHVDLNPSYPMLFLQSLKKMKDEERINESFFQVLLIGEKFEFFNREIQALGLSGIVKHMGRIPHKEAIDYLKKSHLLLLIVETEGIITSKIFEYIAVGKPILALIKEGEIRNLIKKYSQNSYLLFTPDNDEIIMAIEDCYKSYSMHRWEPNKSFAALYNRENQTKQLAGCFNQLIGNHPNQNNFRNI